MKTLFVNVLKRCNLDCKQCYLSNDSRSSTEVLSDKLFLSFIRNPAFADSDFNIVWQGGEISLLPIQTLESLSGLVPDGTKQSLVTNFLAYSSRLSIFVSDSCDRTIETTFSYSGKSTKYGDEQKYRSCFLKAAHDYYNDGLAININVELNAGTIEAGVEELIKFFDKLPPCSIDFDISLSPINQGELIQSTSPYLPTSVNYLSHWQFLKQLNSVLIIKGRGNKTYPIFDSMGVGASTQFSANKYGQFFTLNPDGSVCTNPLYSDQEFLSIGHATDKSDFRSNARYQWLLRTEFDRFNTCRGCSYMKSCGSGASYVPVLDGSGECVGGKSLREKAFNGTLSA